MNNADLIEEDDFAVRVCFLYLNLRIGWRLVAYDVYDALLVRQGRSSMAYLFRVLD